MGADDSKPQAKAAAPQKTAADAQADKQIKMEKVTVNLDQNIENFKNKQAKYQARIEAMKAKAKELMENGRQKQAKKVIEEATKLKKQLQSIEVRRKLIANKKDDLQIHQMNQETIDAMAEANKFTSQDLTGQLEEHIIAQKQAKMLQDQIEQQMKSMVEDDEENEAVDEMMNELQRDIIKDKKKDIEGKKEGVTVQVNKKQVQNNKDDIEDMLNNL